MSKKNWRKIIVDDVEYYWSVQVDYEHSYIVINLNKKTYLTMNIDISESITPSFIRYCILDDNVVDSGSSYGDDDYVSELLVGWNIKQERSKKLKRILDDAE